MTRIGAGWFKTREDGKQYISLAFDKEILPFAITENRKINLWEIPEEKRTDKEKSPHFTIDVFIPEEK
jgi:uncharacterized protein (DUF736 family)